MRIRHDNSLINPSWYLEYVEVIDNKVGEKFMFHCERWLAKNKDDCKIERSFYVKVNTVIIIIIMIIIMSLSTMFYHSL